MKTFFSSPLDLLERHTETRLTTLRQMLAASPGSEAIADQIHRLEARQKTVARIKQPRGMTHGSLAEAAADLRCRPESLVGTPYPLD